MEFEITDKDFSAFTIWHRDSNGKPDETYQSKDGLAGPVVDSINICRWMLGQEKVFEAFTKLARDYTKGRPKYWYKSHNEATHVFIKQILETFPLVFVDDTVREPKCGAIHKRRKWVAPYFEPLNQSILLNGPASGVGLTS